MIKDNIDDPSVTENHRTIIKNKKLLRTLYQKWYELLLKEDYPVTKKTILEIGSGAGFIKERFPGVYCSDILPVSGIDLVFDGLYLPIKNESVTKFIMVDVFHHVKDSKKFITEMQRCLIPGGSIVMIEPYNTLWGRFIWKFFHHEAFLPDVKEWKIQGKGPLSSANGAISWIVFCRDQKIFKEKFPDLVIEEIRSHTSFSYLLSGGLSYPQLVPNVLTKPLLLGDEALCKYFPFTGMFATIKIGKKIL